MVAHRLASPVPASIRIGGALPVAQLDPFYRLLMEAQLTVGWDGEPFSPTFGITGSPLLLMTHHAAGGRFAALEAFCMRHGLAFSRCTDGCGSVVAHRVIFTGKNVPCVYAVDTDEVALIDRATVEKLGNVEAILAYLGAADFEVPLLHIVGMQTGAGEEAADVKVAGEAPDPAKPSAICCLVSVGAVVALAELEEEDQSVPGLYAIVLDQADIDQRQGEGEGEGEGEGKDSPVIEAAKDIFHAAVPIGNLDQFLIDVTVASRASLTLSGVTWLTSADSLLPRQRG